MLSNQAKVTRVAPASFGQLNLLAAASQKDSLSAVGSPSREEAMNIGAPSAMSIAVTVGDSGTTSSIARPYPGWYGSRYVYKGTAFEQNEAKLDVFKRVPLAVSADQVMTALQQLRLQLIDPGSFGGANLDSLTLSQDQDFGYTINFDLRNGAISLYQNWQKWPQYNCRPDGSCDQQQPLTGSDMPGDEAIFAIANDFLKAHGIPTDTYGRPELQNQWREYTTVPQTGGDPEMAVRSMPIYFPESETVLYPQLLNGQQVYDQGGTLSGLMVTVDIRNKRVSGLYGLSVQNYQSSAYDAITDVAKIIQIAEQGGQYGVINYGGYGGVMMDAQTPTSSGSVEPAIKAMPPVEIMPYPIERKPEVIPEINLDTPRLAYVKMYDYQHGNSAELYVPALVFPVISNQMGYYQQNIVVPLILDLIQGPFQVPMMETKGAEILE